MTGSRYTRDIVSQPAKAETSNDTAGIRGRLIAVVVGIDRYEDCTVPDLVCAVNDAESVSSAISQTQPADSLNMDLLTDPPRDLEVARPTRLGILEAAERAATLAGPQDTLLIYFAGHGGMCRDRLCLFPGDVRISEEGTTVSLSNVIAVDELQNVFKTCVCRHRVMFLDCCQNAFSEGIVAERWQTPESEAIGRAVPWRTGLPLTTDLVDVFQQSTHGWSLLLACSPDEVSLEDPEWGAHGVFSHFLATGLRGEADLDGDGVVSLPELVQYLAGRIPEQAEAILDELRHRGEHVLRQKRQNPTMIWNGPIAFPLTRCIQEQRTGWHAGVLSIWVHLLTHRLPYTMAVEGMARYGTALLYGLTMATTVGLFALRAEWESWLSLASATGVTSGLLWLASFALAGAANEARWHSGGYIAALMTTTWHAAIFILLLVVSVHFDPQLVLQLATGLLVVLVVMIVFGHNALHCIIALADLVNRNLRVAGRRAFVQLERHWIHADIDNTLAMVSAHPRLYLVLGLIVAVLAFGDVTYSLFTVSQADVVALLVARDFLLLVLVQWQVQWFAASYRKIRGILLPER